VNSQTTPATLAREVLDLVSLPEIYLKVRELLDDPDATLVDVARVLSVDPGLASRILRIVNSAFCGFATPIETVPHAVTLLGSQQIHDLVLATSIARAFSGIPEELVNMEQFWRTSVFCGAHAMVIADKCGIPDSERIFTTGLLAHVGRLVLYLHLPTAMREAHVDAFQKGISISQALDDQLGFDDAAVAGELLSAWKLPDGLVEPVRNQTHPERHRDGDLGTAIVHVASTISDTRDLHLGTDELIQRLDETAWLALEQNRESLSDLVTDGTRLASNIVDLFLPDPA
jgi:HD-like signal output (HDOD) protein